MKAEECIIAKFYGLPKFTKRTSHLDLMCHSKLKSMQLHIRTSKKVGHKESD